MVAPLSSPAAADAEVPLRDVAPPSSPPVSRRLVSIDTFRGLVMFLMLAEVLHLCGVAAAQSGNRWWQWICFHQSHVAWRGCSLHDLIQPGFTFLVGTALAFSLLSRERRGQSVLRILLHALWRGVVLVLLGVFLRSMHSDQTYWTFEDTLTQIGLGYVPLVLIALLPRWVTPTAILIILVGYWGAFAAYPLPPPDFDATRVGVPADWPHNETGWPAHWNKNTNLAADFDVWFLNLFPRKERFVYNGGGYLTLSFIPTLATMLLGLVAGRWLAHIPRAMPVVMRFAAAALLVGGAGVALDRLGICPSVKRIWTPSWVLVSGGWCFAILGVLHVIVDRSPWKGWTFPLVVIGMNSIAAYLLSWLAHEFIHEALLRHLGEGPFEVLGPVYEPVLIGAGVLIVMWLLLLAMYRQRIFLKI